MMCPKYGGGAEKTNHVFRSCPTSEDVWELVGEHSRSRWGVVAKNTLGKVVASRSMIHADAIATKSLRNGEEFCLEVMILRFIVRITEEEWIRELDEGLVLARKDQLEINDREVDSTFEKLWWKQQKICNK
ncbi:hypothetical protein Goshw_025613 [Gossypium schwendimanii]|uniref:Uncharacterized protein n=1 Tax=Gossypium schwendimanii TaxID=34291 RepID=A0A7J9MDR8_GOSSC|nr:hypothetical protein [Gossypium schwendimanii]